MWLETAWDIFSLGMSIVDVCKDPTDIWAWAGLVGDAVDVLVPCFGGFGETIKGAKTVSKVADTAKVIDKVDDAADAAADTAKTIKKLDKLRDGAKTVDKKGFSEWLSKGDKKYQVYYAITKNPNEAYVGITKQGLTKRLYQHKRNGKDFKRLDDIYKNITSVGGLTRNEARALEQYYIEQFRKTATKPLNKINSISNSFKYYNDAKTWAKNFVSVFGGI